MSTKTRWKRPPVFIYLWKSLVVRHDFHLNIQYLFIYLFIQSDINKSRWNWPPLFTYASHLLWDMVFVWIFSNYLFIYSKRCQQKKVEETTCLYVFFSESEKFRLSYSMLGLTFKNIFLHNCDGNVSKRKTKCKLKSSWNREVHYERKEIYQGQTPQNVKIKIFLQKNSKTSTPLHKICCSHISLQENEYLLLIFINDDNFEIINYYLIKSFWFIHLPYRKKFWWSWKERNSARLSGKRKIDVYYELFI